MPLLALLLLAGGGAGAYFYFGKSEAVASVGETPVAEVEESEDGKPPEITYVELAPIILPIIDRNGISQTISMVVSVQVANEAKAEEVRNKMPRLADAYLSDMYGTLSKTGSMEGGVIKVSMLKERLSGITHKVLGEGVAEDVLLQVLQQHKG